MYFINLVYNECKYLAVYLQSNIELFEKVQPTIKGESVMLKVILHFLIWEILNMSESKM